MSATMESRETAAIHPIEFWTDYTPNATGGVDPSDWVRWVKKGAGNGSTTAEKISRVQKHDPMVWSVVERFYTAWKQGQDAPVTGTPLDALPFMTREMVKVLASVHIRSAEDLANGEDAAMVKLNIPGIRAIREKARAYLDAQANVSGVAAELAALREQVAMLTAERAEAVQTADTMAELAGRPRRGRPPNAATQTQEA